MIIIFNKQRKIKINKERILHTATVVMKELHYQDFDLSIVLTNNKTIRSYNKKYRNKNVPTDILSFPYHQLKAGERIKTLSDDDKNIGDILISIEYVQNILNLYKVSLEERLDTIIIQNQCCLDIKQKEKSSQSKPG